MTPEEEQARGERLRRRMRAARALAGITVKEMAVRIADAGHADGFSARSLGDMERGTRWIKPSEIPVLARACELPEAFFYVDFAKLEEPSIRAELDAVRREVARLQISVAELAADAERNARALLEHREKGHPGGSSQGGER